MSEKMVKTVASKEFSEIIQPQMLRASIEEGSVMGGFKFRKGSYSSRGTTGTY
jgi:hypothetical protein